MRQSGNNIESLLLLCCLVGAVSFYCLSIAATKLLSVSEAAEETGKLAAEEIQIARRMAGLRHDLDSLRNKFMYQQQEIEQSTSADKSQDDRRAEKEQLEKTKKQLEQELDRLEQERQKVAQSLAQELAQAPEKTKESATAEIEALKKKKEKLDKQAQSRQEELARYDSSPPEEETSADLQKKYQELIKKSAEIDNTVKGLRLRILTAGTENYANPIYFDCKANTIRVHPAGRVLASSEIENTALGPMVAGHDIIVLFVRPDGCETFDAIIEKVNDLQKPVCYEPLDAIQSIEPLLGM